MGLWQISILFLLILLTGCIAERSTCCEECAHAASQDPSGYDISIKECSRYELSEGCLMYFEQNDDVVGECREVVNLNG